MIYKLILITFLSIINSYAQSNLRIGVLAYGTVNWELDVIKHHNLDKKNGFNLDIVNLASKNAQLVSLQAKDVNMIVNDWLWVNAQKSKGKNYSYYPYSKATGTLVVNEKSNIKTLLDLKGKNIGIAGGVYDKTWLLIRAYGKSKYDIDLQDIVSPMYAQAPILYKKMQDNSLQAAINFWHFNAKLEANNIKPLIEIKDILKQFDIKDDVSFVGWTFDSDFANENKDLINGFLKASKEAKDLLKNSNEEWNRIKKQMNVKNDVEFEALKSGYKKGIIDEFNKDSINDLEKIYKILLKEGGDKFVSESVSLDNEIFWKFDFK
jgi:NitT/TauT family transport system substrate-binding protein